MRSRLRYLGIALGAGFLAASFVAPPAKRPDIVILEDGSLVGIRQGEAIAISKSKPSDFTLEQWQRALRLHNVVKPVRATRKERPRSPTDPHRLTKEEIDTAGRDIARIFATGTLDRFVCRERHWCAAQLSSGWKILVVEKAGYTGIACELADIVVTPARLKWDTCRSGSLIFTGETLRRSGSAEIFLPDEDELPENIRIVHAMTTANRPWNRHRLYDWKTASYHAPAADK